MPVAEPKRIAGAAGWSEDQYKILFRPLLAGKEADWSMGDDAPPAFLSTLTRPLWDYCKQRFAQVTNPPIDPLREAHVMSLEVPLGHGQFLLGPILSAGELAALCEALPPVQILDFSFPSSQGVPGARRCLTQCISTPLSSGERPGLLLLSDRGVARERAAVPALLAVARAWKNLVGQGLADLPVVVETAQVYDTHHVAMLLAAGASAVVPYLAEEFAEHEEAGGFEKVRKGMYGGLRKVLARMGISTVASYRNSHLFEVLGLDEDICRDYFEDAGFYPGTKTLELLLQDYLKMHAAAFGGESEEMSDHGLYRYRKGAELHANSPEFIRRMHAHVQTAGRRALQRVGRIAQGALVQHSCGICWKCCRNSRWRSRKSNRSKPFLQRFSTQAMSLGSLSPEAHSTLSIAMNRLGGRSNTGEGGEDSDIVPVAGRFVQNEAGGFRAIRRDERVSGARGRAGNQDGPGIEARRRRPVARSEGDRIHRADPPRDAGHAADLSAAAPRHLQHRRPGAIDS